ncbi:predicted protein [Nematostella vectensis]|uniref:Uncharacterized protein n=1 Tax=Nematostella vectensis TaxID=45351 RepID=A7S324_NEMVE|nr:predicted protein [Nematostella vectensis]|eukprot:XP_001633948.1 predicted protein [Nematostella vectensis]
MAKRNLFQGGFALPGLAKDPGAFGFRGKTSKNLGDCDAEVENSFNSSTTSRTSTITPISFNYSDDSVSLLNDSGELLSPKTSKLEHLTKNRPKSPGRRPPHRNVGERSRSCSPNTHGDESFDYGTGLLELDYSHINVSDVQRSPERQPTNAKGSPKSLSDGRESSHLSNFGDVLTTQRRLPEAPKIAMSSFNKHSPPGEENKGKSGFDLGLDLPGIQSGSDQEEDIGDMLIGDYEDSDLESELEKPPLPSSPPPLDKELEINVKNRTTLEKSSEKSTKQHDSTQTTSSKHQHQPSPPPPSSTINKYFPPITLPRHNSLSDKDSITEAKNSEASYSGRHSFGLSEGVKLPPTYGARASKFSDTSSRRRRFKPVSLDLNEDDNLSQTSGESLNKTFPRSFSTQSNLVTSDQKKREIDWGIRVGSLNSSFSESSLKSGTIFDKYLAKKQQVKKLQEKEPQQQENVNSPTFVPHKQFSVGQLPTSEYAQDGTDSKIGPTFEKTVDRSDMQRSGDAGCANDIKQVQSQPLHAERDTNGNISDDDILADIGFGADDIDSSDDNISDTDIVDNVCRYTPSFDDNPDKDKDHDEDKDNDGDYHLFDEADDVIDDLDISAPPRIQVNGQLLELGEDSKGQHALDEGEHNLEYQGSEQERFDIENEPASLVTSHLSEHYDDGDNVNGDDEVRVDEDHDEQEKASGDEGSNLGDSMDDTMVKDIETSGQLEATQQFLNEESVFQPPPMFASSDDEIEEEEEGDVYSEEFQGTSQVASPSKPKKLMPFHKIPLGDWTEEDAREWLDFVGLGHFREQFKAHHVNGRTLKNINFQLLEEIGINSPDEREIVLSEIYDLDNPSDDEELETEIQDALETANEQDKEKILAVYSALRSPNLSGIELAQTSTGSSSPRDSDAGYHLSSDSASLASSVTASDDISHQGSTEVLSTQAPIFPPQSYQTPRKTSSSEKGKARAGRSGKEDSRVKEKKKRKNKDKKRVSKFWESLSLSHASSKLNKIFGSKRMSPSLQYLMQAGPQGILRVWPIALTGQTKYCSFMVSMTTTSAQVVQMVIEKFEVVADPLRYYLCEVGMGKRGVSRALEDKDCPLLLQCRWPDPEKYHFELRCRDEGVVRMLFEMKEYEGDLDYRSIGVSSRTPCQDVMPLIIRKYDLPGTPADYQLMEVSEENEAVREVVAGHVCPLKLQKAWNDIDHVFRLVRIREPADSQTSKCTTSPQPYPETKSRAPPPPIHPAPPAAPPSSTVWYTAGTSSEASSLHGDQDSLTDEHPDHTSEENLTFQASPETNKELDDVLMEVQDQITATDGSSMRSSGLSASVGAQLYELSQAKTNLLAKDQEIESLRAQNTELLEKEKELMVWRMRNSELIEREEEVEHFKAEQETAMKKLQEARESEGKELVLRTEEIEKLYERNKELREKERDYEELKTKMRDLSQTERKLEHLQRLNQDAVAKQLELANERDDLLHRYQELEKETRESRHVLDSGRNDEVERLGQQVIVLEVEKEQALAKLEELQKRNSLLERSAQLLESMRKENEALATKCKDADEMRRNIIKLTTQLREADKARLNQDEIDDLKLSLSISQAEKQQLQTRIDELDRAHADLRETAEEVQRIKKENASLKAQVKELGEIRRSVSELKGELVEAEALKEKFIQLQRVERALRNDLQIQKMEIQRKDGRIDDLERKLTKTADAYTKLKQESNDHLHQRENLNRLLAIIKDKDPALLQLLHDSLSDGSGAREGETEEEEEWC